MRYQAIPRADRRTFIVGAIAALGGVTNKAFALLAPQSDPAAVPKLRDLSFTSGGNLIRNSPDHRDIIGKLQPFASKESPIWNIAQWYSKYELLSAKPEKLSDGSIRYFDGAKALTYGVPGSKEADLIFALNGKTEFGDVPPPKGSSWPHLLLEQRLEGSESLASLSSVDYQISVRLLHSEASRGPDFDPQRHTAQFLSFFRIENNNPTSKGKGDYLWFGVPYYDARYPQPISHAMPDLGNVNKRGTGKFIYNPGGAAYTEKQASTGDWITISHNLLPLMLKALESAWDYGFLTDSKKINDYTISSFNIGWEVTGPWDVAMQIKDLSFKANGKG